MTLSQLYIKSTYSRYNGVKSINDMTGYDTAKLMVDKYKLNIKIEKTQGMLTDHFDPKANVIRLSTDGDNSGRILRLYSLAIAMAIALSLPIFFFFPVISVNL